MKRRQPPSWGAWCERPSLTIMFFLVSFALMDEERIGCLCESGHGKGHGHRYISCRLHGSCPEAGGLHSDVGSGPRHIMLSAVC